MGLGTIFLGFSILRLSTQSQAPCACFGSLFHFGPKIEIPLAILLVAGALHQLSQCREGGVGQSLIGISTLSLISLLFVYRYLSEPALFIAFKSFEDKGHGTLHRNIYLEDSYGHVLSRKDPLLNVEYRLFNKSPYSVRVEALPSCGCIQGSWLTANLGPASSVVYRVMFNGSPEPSTQLIQFSLSDQYTKYLFAFRPK